MNGLRWLVVRALRFGLWLEDAWCAFRGIQSLTLEGRPMPWKESRMVEPEDTEGVWW